MPRLSTRSHRPAVDIGRRLLADRHLQAEIDKGLESLAEMPLVDLAQRTARVLSAVLEPSWREHADFQDQALFPIIAKTRTMTIDTRALLNRLRRDHDEIGKRQREAVVILNNVVAGRLTSPTEIASDLARLVALRRRHHNAEAAIEDMIPQVLDQTDRAALDHWMANRSAPPFPVNLILDFWE